MASVCLYCLVSTLPYPLLLYVLGLFWKCTAVQRKKGRQGGDPRGGGSGEIGRQKAPSASAAAASTQQMRACNQKDPWGHQNEKDLAWSPLGRCQIYFNLG